jgi:predicted glycogen debranching enzyme
MMPEPGERLVRFVGDRCMFELRGREGLRPARGWRALLRTNLGRAEAVRREILEAHTRGLAPAGASWRDLPMEATDQGWRLTLPLAETGFFKAKAYLVDPRGWQHWPGGDDVGLAVHPNVYRTANTIYCAWARLFGDTRAALKVPADPAADALRKEGCAVLPPSGTLRDLRARLPHIFNTLGCRILHLLPVNPAPTTYARFGGMGSPYAALDLRGIDPALVVFDRRTTGVDQFRELTYDVHLRGGRVLLDIVINHTGWGSVLQENHPEWFLKQPDGAFASPGAWGNTWEDLVELKHENVALWDELADVFLTWCRRGVDGFRCDAGYKVPVPAWQYIVARVQQEYPDALFLLEGLGGAWDATEALLTEGGMQWAYSELFQNYSPVEVSGYLDHGLRASQRAGLLVHYSETHDNERLAAKGRAWALNRNQLCALTSVSGAFGFTCGAEWLAEEKIRVHGRTGLAWGAANHLLDELSRLNRLLADHPAFFDGARLERLSLPESPIYALRRVSQEGSDEVRVLVNLDQDHPQRIRLAESEEGTLGDWVDLLGNAPLARQPGGPDAIIFELAAGGAVCLAPRLKPRGLHGEAYRQARARAAWGMQACARLLPINKLPSPSWLDTAALVDRDPAGFLIQATHQARGGDPSQASPILPAVVRWKPEDVGRVTLVPPGYWLLVEDLTAFRAALGGGEQLENVESIFAAGKYFACFPPRDTAGDAQLLLERYGPSVSSLAGAIRFLPKQESSTPPALPGPEDRVLLVNQRGGMARLCVDLGRVISKYDCVLGANLHPSLPVDRHILAKRLRIWANADGFISPLDYGQLRGFRPGPPATWKFVANAGDGRTVEIEASARMLEDRNTVLFQFRRPGADEASGKQLPAGADVRLTVRVDVEDRNFHGETKRNPGADHHFESHTHPLPAPPGRMSYRSQGTTDGECFQNGLPSGAEWMGFAFTPAQDRSLRAFSDAGCFHLQPEWCCNIPHPVEQTRGQEGAGDAFSPGWFELPLPKGGVVSLVITADPEEQELEPSRVAPVRHSESPVDFAERLRRAAAAFVVRRGDAKTVIAGYPWFLDWGRDTLICARGLLAGGFSEEVLQLLVTFGRFEQQGTLPNTIHGADASNRDTSDAPLWFGVVCEEAAEFFQPQGRDIYGLKTDPAGRTLRDVLGSIATHYARGTPNGIRLDPDSGLIWSPAHFTWMDTNYPAGTPRQGYPVEIQALWIRLLRQVQRLGIESSGLDWADLERRAVASLDRLFWRSDGGYFADVLHAQAGQPAASAICDDALRSNCLFLVSLGLINDEKARRCVEACRQHLVVPGALRSLAPLGVRVPLAIVSPSGAPLNDPWRPYWGRYEGDEDTRRKPAYHNGTAWTWTFPVFCEALARAWNRSPEAVATARSYLLSMETLLDQGCLGHLPEIVDGDAPHRQRGCDAQAWGATEALRVWTLLHAG